MVEIHQLFGLYPMEIETVVLSIEFTGDSSLIIDGRSSVLAPKSVQLELDAAGLPIQFSLDTDRKPHNKLLNEIKSN